MAQDVIGNLAIRLGVNADDLKRSLDEAGARISKSTRAMAGEMRSQTTEARHSIHLLGDELGVHIPRALQSTIAKLPGFGAALAGAFPVIAAIEIGKILFELPEAIGKIKAKFTEMSAEEKKAHEETVRFAEDLHKLAEKSAELNKQILELSMSPDRFAEAQLQTAKAREFATQQQISALKSLKAMEEEAAKGTIVTFGESGRHERPSDEALDAKQHAQDLGTAITRLQNELAVMQQESAKADASMKKLFGQDNKKQAEEAARAIEKSNAALKELVQFGRELDKRGADESTRTLLEYQEALAKISEQMQKFPHDARVLMQAQLDIDKNFQAMLRTLDELAAKAKADVDKHTGEFDLKNLASALPAGGTAMPTLINGHVNQELRKVHDSAEEAGKALQSAIEDSLTPSEKLRQQLEVMGYLLQKYPQFSVEITKAMGHMKDQLDPVRVATEKFGETMGSALQNIIERGGDLRSLLSALLVDLAKLAVQAAVMDSIQGMSGGFFKSLLGGFFGVGSGHALGGPVLPGMAYPINETVRAGGTEYFMPGVPGTILPNAGGVGAKLYQHFDFRNAVGLDQATISRVVDQASQRGAAMAISAIDERGRRR